jgi:predicted membrane protein
MEDDSHIQDYIDDRKNSLVKAIETRDYSLKRLDIVFISISLVGIVYLGQRFEEVSNCSKKLLLNLSLLLFLIVVLSNLVAQVISYIANSLLIKIIREDIKSLTEKINPAKVQGSFTMDDYLSRKETRIQHLNV